MGNPSASSHLPKATVYFTASVVGKKHYLPHYLRIIRYLESRGLTVLADHILQADEAKIRLETKAQRLSFLKQLDSWINSSSCMVVEASFPSISVGYEISLALRRNKPVLILYSDGNPPSLLSLDGDERIICEKYDGDSLHGLLDMFLGYVNGSCDTRFTFYITSEISSYLDRVATEKRLPKAVYLRQLILNDMGASHASP